MVPLVLKVPLVLMVLLVPKAHRASQAMLVLRVR